MADNRPLQPYSDTESDVEFFSAHDEEVVIMNTPDTKPAIDDEVIDVDLSRTEIESKSNIDDNADEDTKYSTKRVLETPLVRFDDTRDNLLVGRKDEESITNDAEVIVSDDDVVVVTSVPRTHTSVVDNNVVEVGTRMTSGNRRSSYSAQDAEHAYDSASEESYESSFVTSDDDVVYVASGSEEWTPGTVTSSSSTGSVSVASKSSEDSVVEVLSPRSQIKAEVIDLTLEGPWTIPRGKPNSQQRPRPLFHYDSASDSDSDDTPPRRGTRRRLSLDTDNIPERKESTPLPRRPLRRMTDSEVQEENSSAPEKCFPKPKSVPSTADDGNANGDIDDDFISNKENTPPLSTANIDGDLEPSTRITSPSEQSISIIDVDGENTPESNETPPAYKPSSIRERPSVRRVIVEDESDSETDSTLSDSGELGYSGPKSGKENDEVDLTKEELDAIEKLNGAFSSFDTNTKSTSTTATSSSKKQPAKRRKAKAIKANADVTDLTEAISQVKVSEKGGMPVWLSSISPKGLSRGNVAERLMNYLDMAALQSALRGAVTVTWNKRLLTTAGTCTLCRRGASTRVARIELSTKVLDEPGRVYQTLAHEMCHAAAWIVDGVAKPPHGKAFKRWAGRFRAWDKNLEIDTCHTYKIRTKFKYFCEKCGHEWGRHSKSIDTAKVGCSCGGKIKLLVG